MNKRTLNRKFGPWAIVTGASSGIGKEFCDQLAAAGLNLVLVSRRQEMLDRLGNELSDRHGIKTQSLALDLSEPDFLKSLVDATQALDVGLVVSNAGADHMGALLRIPLEDLRAMQRLNAASHLDIAHYFGTRFLAHRKTAGLLFVSSTASLQATPLLANYAGAKAYVRTLSQALNAELKGTGVNVSVLIPGPTETPAFSERTDIDLIAMPMPPMATSPVVKAGLKAIAKNKPYVIPGVMNSVMDFMGRKIMTRGMSAGMWGMLMNKAAPAHLKIQKRAPNDIKPIPVSEAELGKTRA